jgi:hypothetical protein
MSATYRYKGSMTMSKESATLSTQHADCSYGVAVLLVVLAIWGEGLILNTFGVTGQVHSFIVLPLSASALVRCNKFAATTAAR